MPEVPHITIKLPNLNPLGRQAQADDLMFIWDSVKGELVRCSVSDLPFGSGGGGGSGEPGVYLGSPFKVRTTSPSMAIVENPAGVFNTVITDLRLIGKSDYIVNSTQLNNAAFRDADVIYDSVNGKVTIKNFVLLAGEFVNLYPDGIPQSSGGSGGADLQALLDRIELLELMAAPFKPTPTGANGGAVLFMRPLSEIPTGWEEVVEMRGRMPLGLDPGDDDFKTLGKAGGTKTRTLTIGNLPKHSFTYLSPSGNGSASGNRDNHPDGPMVERQTATIGNDEAFDLMNPNRIVYFIRFAGL